MTRAFGPRNRVGTNSAVPDGVTHRNVEALIGRLATDPTVRRRFVDDPGGFLRELTAQGYALTPVAIEALASTTGDAIRLFADTLDSRIRRAALNADPAAPQDKGEMS